MSLKSFVQKFPGGRSALAKVLEVDPEAIRLWELRRRTPRGHHMKKLLRLARGKVTAEDLIKQDQAA